MLNLHSPHYSIFTVERYLRYLELLEMLVGLPDDRPHAVRALHALFDPLDRGQKERGAIVARLKRDGILRRERADCRIAYALRKDRIGPAAERLRAELSYHDVPIPGENRERTLALASSR